MGGNESRRQFLERVAYIASVITGTTACSRENPVDLREQFRQDVTTKFVPENVPKMSIPIVEVTSEPLQPLSNPNPNTASIIFKSTLTNTLASIQVAFKPNTIPDLKENEEFVAFIIDHMGYPVNEHARRGVKMLRNSRNQIPTLRVTQELSVAQARELQEGNYDLLIGIRQERFFLPRNDSDIVPVVALRLKLPQENRKTFRA